MLFKNIGIIDEHFNYKENMYVVVEKDMITYIGKDRPTGVFGREVDGKGRLIMPGFYNGHAHSPMTLLRGYGENMVLSDWLNKRIFPFEEKLNGERVYWGTLLAMAESIKNGIVSTTDMYYFLPKMIEAIVESGSKNNVSRGIVAFDNTPLKDMESFREMKSAVKSYNGVCGNRIIVDASLHGEYTSNPNVAKDLADFARENNLGMHVHVSETVDEHQGCKERRNGLTPVAYLNSLGLFDVRTTAAHCVHIEDEDYDILAEKKVTVATNPSSNLKLSSGICNGQKILDKGINLSIGTDSVASNNSLNMFNEMKLFALLGKIKDLDPTAITPKQALFAATRGGATAQGRWDCGLIKEGMKADLLVIRTDSPSMVPVHNMEVNLVYSADNSLIEMTMVDGNILYENGNFRTIDIEKVKYQVEKHTQNILKELN